LSFKKVTLYREVNQKIRYYSINLCPTLFGDFLLIKEFGSMCNKKPTRIIKEYFSYVEDSLQVIDSFINAKIKKGYLQANN
jgi:hypothetical protein